MSLGQATGLSEEEIDALREDYEASTVLSARDKAVARWAESVTRYEAPEDDEAFNRLKEFFTDDEIVELTWTTALFNMINRVHDSLQLDIEDQHEVDKIRRSSRLSQQQVLGYVRRALELAEIEATSPLKREGSSK